jgi:threonine/homoserine/homoserine lactone efflux protein
MFGITYYELFIATGIMLNLTPGSDTIYILSRSIGQGSKAGVYACLGISTGCIVHTLLAALGLSVILAQSALAFMAVKIAGAVYLGYLGITTLMAKKNTMLALDQSTIANRDIYWQGLLTNVLNPKVALFFLSFLPQFIDPENAYGITPFILLGLTFFLTGTIWNLLLVLFSSGITAFLRQNNTVANLMNKICGGIYVLLGVKLLNAER